MSCSRFHLQVYLQTVRVLSTNVYFFKDSGTDELERLRQEIRHLKMELGNRETNFNRLFTAHQPVYVSHHQPMKFRTDLTNQLQLNRGDSAMTSSRYFSIASGRSVTQPSAVGLRAATGKFANHALISFRSCSVVANEVQ